MYTGLRWMCGRNTNIILDSLEKVNMDKIEAVDINDPVDFEIADAIYNAGLYRKD